MPLQANIDGVRTFGFDVSPSVWTSLKGGRSTAVIRTTCCGNRAVCVTNSRGTQFFKHHRRGNCTTAPESPDHRLAKEIVVLAARSAGWSAQTEVRGSTLEGDEWVADVVATSAKRDVAFEIQISPQTAETTLERHGRYVNSGPQDVWLLRSGRSAKSRGIELLHRAGVAAFELTIDPSDGSMWVPGFHTSLADLVTRALDGELVFSPERREEAETYEVEGTLDLYWAPEACHRCGKTSHAVAGGVVRYTDRVGYIERGDIRWFDVRTIHRSLRDQYGIKVKDRLLAQQCPHCLKRMRRHAGEEASYLRRRPEEARAIHGERLVGEFSVTASRTRPEVYEPARWSLAGQEYDHEWRKSRTRAEQDSAELR